MPRSRSWSPDHPYVGRGGLKLAHALDTFGIEVRGRDGLDIGASTGGFTDVLLQRGARHVVALDVGHGQIDWRLRNDPRVLVIEGMNARHLLPAHLPGPVDVVTIDVSFISLRLVLPAVPPLLRPGADVVALVKPQFEAGRDEVGRGGLVLDVDCARACRRRSVCGGGCDRISAARHDAFPDNRRDGQPGVSAAPACRHGVRPRRRCFGAIEVIAAVGIVAKRGLTAAAPHLGRLIEWLSRPRSAGSGRYRHRHAHRSGGRHAGGQPGRSARPRRSRGGARRRRHAARHRGSRGRSGTPDADSRGQLRPARISHRSHAAGDARRPRGCRGRNRADTGARHAARARDERRHRLRRSHRAQRRGDHERGDLTAHIPRRIGGRPLRHQRQGRRADHRERPPGPPPTTLPPGGPSCTPASTRW